MTQIFHLLSKITAEPSALPPVEHSGAHILNAPLFERKYARVYLGDQESREATSLRRQIVKGAREALEEQYWDVLERTLQARPMDARLGGDPSIANRVRAFVLVRHYRNGEWGDRVEVCGQFQPSSTALTSYAACRGPTCVGQTVLSRSHWSHAGSN
jgi:nuclear pore complex protein Nup93